MAVSAKRRLLLHGNPDRSETLLYNTYQFVSIFVMCQSYHECKSCTTTEDGWRLKISDLGSKDIVLSIILCSENKGADKLRDDCEADLRLCFCICKKQVFS